MALRNGVVEFFLLVCFGDALSERDCGFFFFFRLEMRKMVVYGVLNPRLFQKGGSQHGRLNLTNDVLAGNRQIRNRQRKSKLCQLKHFRFVFF